MQISTNLVKFLVSELRRDGREIYNSLYFNDKDNYLFCFVQGRASFLVVFDNAPLPKLIDPNSIRRVSYIDLNEHIKPNKAWVDLNQLPQKEANLSKVTIKTLNRCLSLDKAIATPENRMVPLNIFTAIASLFRAATGVFVSKRLKLSIEYINFNKYRFKGEANKVTIIGLVSPVVSD